MSVDRLVHTLRLAAGLAWAAVAACAREERTANLGATGRLVWSAPPDTQSTALFDVAVAGPESFWTVVLGGPSAVALVGADGGAVRRVGPWGQGPTDVSFPGPIVSVDRQSGFADVWDPGVRALKRLSANGEVHVLWSLDGVSAGMVAGDLSEVLADQPNRLQATKDGFVLDLYRISVGKPSAAAAATLVRLDPQGRLRDTVVDFSAIDAEREVASSKQIWLPLLPVWDACAEGVAYYSNARRVLVLPDGRRLQPYFARAPRAELSPEQRTELVRRMVTFEMKYRPRKPSAESLAALVVSVKRRMEDALPRSFPDASQVLCGQDSSVWIAEFDHAAMPRGVGSRWIRITPAGEQRVTLPSRFYPTQVYGDTLIGKLVDVDGVESPAIVVVTVPKT